MSSSKDRLDKMEDAINLARCLQRPLYSGLPAREKLMIDLLKIRAAVPDTSGEGASLWVKKAVEGLLPIHHSFGYVTPYGDVTILADELKALNWLKSELEKIG